MRIQAVLTAAAAAFAFGCATSFAADAGATGFATNCAFCHQLDGKGLSGQFPRIAGRLNVIASSTSGREYVGSLLLYGMSGAVKVDDSTIVGVMPSFAALTDAQIAEILNFVLRFDGKSHKVKGFTAAELKALRRTQPLSASAVHALRDALPASEAIRK